MAQKTCPVCKQPILPTDETIPYKNRTAHSRCLSGLYDVLANERKDQHKTKEQKKKQELKEKKSPDAPKPQIEVAAPVSEEEYAKKKAFYDYLREMIGDVESKHYAISEKLIKQYGFTFEGMHQTLQYLDEILNKVAEGNILGLIPYYYEEAINHNKELDEIEQKNKGKNINEMYHTNIVKIGKKVSRKKEIDF